MRMLFLTIAMLLALSIGFSVPVSGQAGDVVLYADDDADGDWSCYFRESYVYPLPQLRTVYVVHATSPGTTGVSFRLIKSVSPTVWWVYFWLTSPFTVTGHPEQGGLTIDYGDCLAGDIVVAELLYEVYGGSGVCSSITPVAHDAASGEIEVTLCDGTTTVAGARVFLVNFDSDDCEPWCLPLPVESTTWGQIKALYRE